MLYKLQGEVLVQAVLLSQLFGKNEYYNKAIQIAAFLGEEQMKSRFIEIGLYPGSLLTILGQSPFNGPLMVQSGSAVFCLRKEEAQCIQIAMN